MKRKLIAIWLSSLAVILLGSLSDPRTAEAASPYCTFVALEPDSQCEEYTPPDYESCGRCVYEDIWTSEIYMEACWWEDGPAGCVYVTGTEQCAAVLEHCQHSVFVCDGLQNCSVR